MGSVWRRLSRVLSGGLFVGAAATASMAVTTPACQTSVANSGQTPCPPGQTCQVHLTLLHTADIHSRLLPYDLLITQVDGDLGLGTTGDVRNVGGAARMAHIINREKARSERVLHLSGGDVFEGAPIFNFFSGEPEMRVQAALGVDAMTLANHEFDRGASNVARQIQKWADFPVLASNYVFDNPALPTSTPLGAFVQPFTVLNAGGLKVAVIGMANLSSLTSIFDTPNSFGVTPLNSTEVVQFYVDMLRPLADLVVVDSHLGLDVDQRVITQTTGVDVWLGSHNHIVINPPEVVRDCSDDPQNPGYIWVLDPNLTFDTSKPPPNDADHPDPSGHPYQMHRACTPRNVLLAHSGAFAKYVGRLDVVLSNDPAEATPTGNPADYDPANSFEVVSSKYQIFPITDQVPEDEVVKQMLEPYARQLSIMANLTVIAGFSPSGAKRTAPAKGDSPLGNLIATANWLRLGVQTDFSMTNTTGIRQDLLPGPVTVDEMYDIFPFDNAITKMTLSGAEVYQMYDFIARRSAARGCVSQAQVAGSRVQINCTGCNRTFLVPTCLSDADCPAIETTGVCNLNASLPDGEHPCFMPGCADAVYVGFTSNSCQSDKDCPDLQGNPQPGACSKPGAGQTGVCMTPVVPTNVYELATSDYLASGGSGFRVLQRNTTQINTGIQQRDAVIDYIRAGKPCGWQDPSVTNTPDGLWPCATDADCTSAPNLGSSYVCGCDGASTPTGAGSTLTCASGGSCDPSVGRCIRADCRDTVAQTRAALCAESQSSAECMTQLSPCDAASAVCQLVACVDDKLGALTDNRVQMLGR